MVQRIVSFSRLGRGLHGVFNGYERTEVSVDQNMKRSEHEEDVIRKHSERQTHRNFMFLFR